MSVTNGHPRPRDEGLGASLAQALSKAQVSPEAVLVAGVGFALGGCAAFGLAGLSEGAARVVWLGFAVISIQLRMTCAVVGRLMTDDAVKGPATPLWKSLPDRIGDVLLLVGAGYASLQAGDVLSPALGWLCAVLAVSASYVRELGRGAGIAIDRVGPVGKGRRMAILSAGALVSMLEWVWGWHGEAMLIALVILAALTTLTVFNRARRLARGLRPKS